MHISAVAPTKTEQTGGCALSLKRRCPARRHLNAKTGGARRWPRFGAKRGQVSFDQRALRQNMQMARRDTARPAGGRYSARSQAETRACAALRAKRCRGRPRVAAKARCTRPPTRDLRRGHQARWRDQVGAAGSNNKPGFGELRRGASNRRAESPAQKPLQRGAASTSGSCPVSCPGAVPGRPQPAPRAAAITARQQQRPARLHRMDGMPAGPGNAVRGGSRSARSQVAYGRNRRIADTLGERVVSGATKVVAPSRGQRSTPRA